MLYLYQELGQLLHCYAMWSSYCLLHCKNNIVIRHLFKTKLHLYFDDNELQNIISHFVLALKAIIAKVMLDAKYYAIQGHSRSPMSVLRTNRKTICDFLLVTNWKSALGVCHLRPNIHVDGDVSHQPFCTNALQICYWGFSHKESL